MPRGTVVGDAPQPRIHKHRAKKEHVGFRTTDTRIFSKRVGRISIYINRLQHRNQSVLRSVLKVLNSSVDVLVN